MRHEINDGVDALPLQVGSQLATQHWDPPRLRNRPMTARKCIDQKEPGAEVLEAAGLFVLAGQ